MEPDAYIFMQCDVAIYDGAGSDIDILVDSGLRGLAFFGLLEGITSTLDVPVDLIDVSQIEKGSHIEMEIQQTGVPIYEQ